MIRGVGIDVIHVQRMERWHKVPGLLERYFFITKNWLPRFPAEAE